MFVRIDRGRRTNRGQRRGTVLPMLVATIVVLMGFVALAIDIGLLALARTQAQNAADAAALTGARSLTGDASSDNNFAACEPAARVAARANVILSQPIQDPQISVSIGSYTYDETLSK